MVARFASGSANAQKTKEMSRAGDGGTAHATGVREGVPLNAILRPFPPSSRAFSLPGVMRGRLQFAPARMALMRSE